MQRFGRVWCLLWIDYWSWVSTTGQVPTHQSRDGVQRRRTAGPPSATLAQLCTVAGKRFTAGSASVTVGRRWAGHAPSVGQRPSRAEYFANWPLLLNNRLMRLQLKAIPIACYCFSGGHDVGLQIGLTRDWETTRDIRDGAVFTSTLSPYPLTLCQCVWQLISKTLPHFIRLTSIWLNFSTHWSEIIY